MTAPTIGTPAVSCPGGERLDSEDGESGVVSHWCGVGPGPGGNRRHHPHRGLGCSVSAGLDPDPDACQVVLLDQTTGDRPLPGRNSKHELLLETLPRGHGPAMPRSAQLITEELWRLTLLPAPVQLRPMWVTAVVRTSSTSPPVTSTG